MSYDGSYLNFKHVILVIDIDREPKNFHEACNYPHWRKAMNDEINDLKNNQTWTLTNLPNDKSAISYRLIYKSKVKLMAL